jgi:hypothetical protein
MLKRDCSFALLIILGIAASACGTVVPDGYSRVNVRLGGVSYLLSEFTALTNSCTGSFMLTFTPEATALLPQVHTLDLDDISVDSETPYEHTHEIFVKSGLKGRLTLEGVAKCPNTAGLSDYFPVFAKTGLIEIKAKSMDVNLDGYTHRFMVEGNDGGTNNTLALEGTQFAKLTVNLTGVIGGFSGGEVKAETHYADSTYKLLGKDLVYFFPDPGGPTPVSNSTATMGPIFPTAIGKLRLTYTLLSTPTNLIITCEPSYDLYNNNAAAGEPPSYTITLTPLSPGCKIVN